MYCFLPSEAVAKKAEVETGQHQVSAQEKIKGADTVDAGIVNHRTKEVRRLDYYTITELEGLKAAAS